MKKTYFAPELIQEVFETADVITVSFNVVGGYNNTEEKQLTAVNYNDREATTLWND